MKYTTTELRHTLKLFYSDIVIYKKFLPFRSYVEFEVKLFYVISVVLKVKHKTTVNFYKT